MKRIIRNRRLTKKEASKYNKIRQQAVQDFPPAKVTGLRRRCFVCNGTGEICNVCGEAQNCCECGGDNCSPCKNCGGIGIAILDQTAEEKERGKAHRENKNAD